MSSPPPGTVERWAYDYVLGSDLALKLDPPPPPATWEPRAPHRRLVAPGRPLELRVSTRAAKMPRQGALRSPARRAQLLHTFLHHELQAAELMCWALLAFPDTPRAFRLGLLRIATDELRHMHLYRQHLEFLEHRVGDFPVRDWFWERVPHAPTAAHFVAVMGIGFEGGNLDHTARFAHRFREAGDHLAAAIEEQVAVEEIPHVRFALSWFVRFTEGHQRGAALFAEWAAHLPAPLSPLLMKGEPMNEAARLRSGFAPTFLAELASTTAAGLGSTRGSGLAARQTKVRRDR